MSATNIERKINYSMAGPDNDTLFDPIKVEAVPSYALQFFITGLVASSAYPTGRIVLKVSNNGIDFVELPAGQVLLGRYETALDESGTYTRYIFVGLNEGVGTVQWITAAFKKGNITEGIISKVIMEGELGNS